MKAKVARGKVMVVVVVRVVVVMVAAVVACGCNIASRASPSTLSSP